MQDASNGWATARRECCRVLMRKRLSVMKVATLTPASCCCIRFGTEVTPSVPVSDALLPFSLINKLMEFHTTNISNEYV